MDTINNFNDNLFFKIDIVEKINKRIDIFKYILFITSVLFLLLIMFDVEGLILKINLIIVAILFIILLILNIVIPKYRIVGYLKFDNKKVEYNINSLNINSLFLKEDIISIKIDYDGYEGETYSFLRWSNVKNGFGNTIQIKLNDKIIKVNNVLLKNNNDMLFIKEKLIKYDYKVTISDNYKWL